MWGEDGTAVPCGRSACDHTPTALGGGEPMGALASSGGAEPYASWSYVENWLAYNWSVPVSGGGGCGVRSDRYTYTVTSTTLRFHGARAAVTVSSRVGAALERREREQKRSGGEGGGSANILVRGMKCSVAFVHRFRFENHWQLLQHLDRRSQAEQSKIAGIVESKIGRRRRCRRRRAWWARHV
eukprot:COSAG04_NODE_205_length_20393_cov_45.275796_11_plen_184_part_00